jgi:hypothetical protein
MQYKLVLPSYLRYVPFLVPSCVSCDIKVCQTANSIHTSYEELANFLESIEHFLNRLRIYTQIPSTPSMDELVIQILAELLSTLALATKELKQGRSGKSFLTDELFILTTTHSKL